jgi:hypothetical protein
MRGWPAEFGGSEDDEGGGGGAPGGKMADYSWVPPGLPSSRLVGKINLLFLVGTHEYLQESIEALICRF